MLKEFQRAGRELTRLGLISSHAGNMSARKDDKLFITRRGCMLGDLQEGDIIGSGLEHIEEVPLVSTEALVHRAIYQTTSARAIIHCHPPFAITLSLGMEAIIPLDSEGSFHLRQIPVLVVSETVGSKEVAHQLPPILKEYRVAMIRGHGSFAVGASLEEALMVSSTLESSSKIIAIAKALGMEF